MGEPVLVRRVVSVSMTEATPRSRTGIKRLLFLGSSCIYPKLAPQPMRERDLLTGPLEPTNRPYALAKIAGVERFPGRTRRKKAAKKAIGETGVRRRSEDDRSRASRAGHHKDADGQSSRAHGFYLFRHSFSLYRLKWRFS